MKIESFVMESTLYHLIPIDGKAAVLFYGNINGQSRAILALLKGWPLYSLMLIKMVNAGIFDAQ